MPAPQKILPASKKRKDLAISSGIGFSAPTSRFIAIQKTMNFGHTNLGLPFACIFKTTPSVVTFDVVIHTEHLSEKILVKEAHTSSAHPCLPGDLVALYLLNPN